MTNNTILNVSRELLADLLGNDHDKRIMAERHLLAMLANAPSPAGVDVLEVIGWYTEDHLDDKSATTYSREVANRWLAKGWPVIGIANESDAQAIIDGLRGGVERLQFSLEVAKTDELSAAVYAETESIKHSLWNAEKECDQHAQRIGELEGLLRAESARVDFLDAYIVTADAPDTGKVAMLADSGTLRECIDAAHHSKGGGVMKIGDRCNWKNQPERLYD